MNNFKIKDLPCYERPRERLLKHGCDALALPELIAVLLGNGTKGKSVLQLAQELLAHFGSLEAIGEATIEELCHLRGLGMAKAIQLKAALGLAGRLSKEADDLSVSVATPEKAYLHIKGHFDNEKREIFGIILQNAKGRMIRWEVISIGTLTQTLVHPREVFYPAIRHQAASLILFHNHPSGDLSPSKEDIQATQQLIGAGKMMGIPAVDHLIISPNGYLSLREKRYCFF